MIEKNQGVCGGRATISGTRIPVWILGSITPEGFEESILLESYPTLSAEDLDSAWDYVAENLEEINSDIEDNVDPPENCFECGGGHYVEVVEDYHATLPNGEELVVPHLPIFRCDKCGKDIIPPQSSRIIELKRKEVGSILKRFDTPFTFKAPAWLNGPAAESIEESLKRAFDIASSYYAAGVQTGIHSMIEWCGVMTEYCKMLDEAHKLGHDPREVDKHHEGSVDLPSYMVEYFCSKLGCQLIPFMKGNLPLWKKELDGWIKEATPKTLDNS